ncbi:MULTISPECIES: hypothetical protein [Clostridia]|uniref:hypothetical protein n=1 Tax=Clostridia TaxID=186801 RepID=UPI0011C2193D|nr:MULTISPECIES: hypothetical protein [Clostridia]
MKRIHGDKGIMPLTGMSRRLGAKPVFNRLPLSDEPMRPCRGRISKVDRCWAHAPDVPSRLFRYPQAHHFILSYLRTKTSVRYVA